MPCAASAGAARVITVVQSSMVEGRSGRDRSASPRRRIRLARITVNRNRSSSRSYRVLPRHRADAPKWGGESHHEHKWTKVSDGWEYCTLRPEAVAKLKRLLMYVTRFAGRPAGKTFARNVSHPGWRKADADLRVLVMGDGDVWVPESVPFVRFGDVTLPQAIWAGMVYAVKKKYAAVGFIDDDARLKNPVHATRQFLKGVEQGYGAFGPIHPMRVWQKYGDKPGSGFHEISIGRMTSGCQIYSVAFVENGSERIRQILSLVRWWSDYPIFMIAHKLGFKIGEVYTPYIHPSHTMFVRRNKHIPEAERKRFVQYRRRLMMTDAKRIVAFFQEWSPDYVPYAQYLVDAVQAMSIVPEGGRRIVERQRRGGSPRLKGI